jgi:hypothetical protein
MEYFVGAGLALAVGVCASAVGLDRDRSFYATILIVVASYYDLFAFMGGTVEVAISEAAVAAAFVCVAVVGLRTNLWLVVIGLCAHGTFDLFHDRMINNPGVPLWWRSFCLSYDVIAGAYLAWRLLQPSICRICGGLCKCGAHRDLKRRFASQFGAGRAVA